MMMMVKRKEKEKRKALHSRGRSVIDLSLSPFLSSIEPSPASPANFSYGRCARRRRREKEKNIGARIFIPP